MLSSSNLKQNSNIMLLAFQSVGVAEALMVGNVLMTVATPANRDFPMAPSIPATPCCMKPFGNDPSDWPMSRNENATSFHLSTRMNDWIQKEWLDRASLAYWVSENLQNFPNSVLGYKNGDKTSCSHDFTPPAPPFFMPFYDVLLMPTPPLSHIIYQNDIGSALCSSVHRKVIATIPWAVWWDILSKQVQNRCHLATRLPICPGWPWPAAIPAMGCT